MSTPHFEDRDFPNNSKNRFRASSKRASEKGAPQALKYGCPGYLLSAIFPKIVKNLSLVSKAEVVFLSYEYPRFQGG